MTDVEVVRLTTGEELLGKVNQDAGNDQVYIENPFIIVPTGDGKLTTMQFMPYTNVSKGGLFIDRRHVMWIVTPAQQLVDGWKDMSGSILTPNNKIIV